MRKIPSCRTYCLTSSNSSEFSSDFTFEWDAFCAFWPITGRQNIDESHDKVSKKDLLIGKRKDKKDKKDRGYATLEGESSPEEDADMRSPSKVKKSKPFKFSSKKEKREKSRDKETKEKESDKDKKKTEEKEKEKKKDVKVKLKFKEKKKDKKDDVVDISEFPLFLKNQKICQFSAFLFQSLSKGANATTELKSRSSFGTVLTMYRKSRVARTDIDGRAAGTFRRGRRCERSPGTGGTFQTARQGTAQLQSDPPRLDTRPSGSSDPTCKLKHCHMRCVMRYVPPLKSVSPGLPETPEGLALELSKQESLLSQLHREMAQGLAGQDRVEQLWTVQRTVTHLKRMLRSMEKTSGQRSLDDTDSISSHRTTAKVSPGEKSTDHRVPFEKSVPHTLTIPPPPAFQNSVSAPSSVSSQNVPVLGPQLLPPTSMPSLASLPQTSLPPASLPPQTSLPPPTSLPPSTTSLPPTAVVPPLPPPPGAAYQIPPLPPPVEKTASRKTSLFQGYDDDSAWTGPCKMSAEQKSATIGTMRGRMPLPADCTNPWQKRPPLVQQEDAIIAYKQVATAESLEVQDINKESTEKADRMQKAIIESEELMNLVNKLKAECANERAAIAKLKEQINLLGGMPELSEMPSDDSDDEKSPTDAESNSLWKRRQELNQEAVVLRVN
ncbi:unnamed protein product [Nesidiocoris tenuis]|uniref:Uncharacterized protein n=1 Tax=Nesidiocoris tenuis TaxID=355587 RepID=A0A6H5G771_9HEMI|nr:unnamed protein product [Nesidiocoris tenuis]